jgi:hypothetical protein
MSEWKNIESAPRDDTSVLLCVESEDGEQSLHVGSFYHNKWYISGYSISESKKLSWMPLPKPPKKKHYCENDDGLICRTRECGQMVLRFYSQVGREIYLEVKSCPFCGEKASEDD